MILVNHTNIYKVRDYAEHLKRLSEEDKISRFGYVVRDDNIDKLALSMLYDFNNHELWYAEINKKVVGWGHLAKNDDDSWELAVSVDKEYQRQGVATELIKEILSWSKVRHVHEVFMHCIEDNSVIQHLATKFDLKTRYRGGGERTASLIVPGPTFFELTSQQIKEQTEILAEMSALRRKLAKLWTGSLV